MDEITCINIQNEIENQIKRYKDLLPCVYNKDTKKRIKEVIKLLEKLYHDFDF